MARTIPLQGFQGSMQPLGSIRTNDAVHHKGRVVVQTAVATSGAGPKDNQHILRSLRVGMAPGSLGLIYANKGKMNWVRLDGSTIHMSDYRMTGVNPRNVAALEAAQAVVARAKSNFSASKGKVHGLVIGDGGVQITKWNQAVQALGKHKKG